MGSFSALDVGASGLTAQRLRMDTISQNIANANTTRTEKGTPYRRKIVVFEEMMNNVNGMPTNNTNEGINSALIGSGVRVTKIAEDPSEFRKIYEPGHPDANKDGYVEMPNIDLVTEMVNMISATRAYEANITSINASKSMAVKALEIGRG